MKRTITIILITISVFCLFWLTGIPALFNVLYPICIAKFEKKYNYKINTENLSLQTFLPAKIKINIDKFEIINPNNQKIIIAKAPEINLSTLAILFGKLTLTSVNIKDLQANLFLDEPILKEKNLVDKIKNITLDARNIEINEHFAKIAPTQNSENVQIQGNDFIFQNNNNNKTVKLNSKILSRKNEAIFKIDSCIPKALNKNLNQNTFILIENLNIASITDIFNKNLPTNIKKAEGNINLKLENNNLNAKLNNIKLITKEDYQSIILPEILEITGNTDFSENEMVISNLNLLGDKFNINTGILLKKTSKRDIWFEVKAKSQDSSAKTIINILPAINLPEINLDALKKYPLYGDVNGDITVSGTQNKPAINGNIEISNAYLIKPIKNDNKKANIKLNFADAKVFYDVLVGAGGLENVSVKGETELFETRNSNMLIKSSKNISLKTAQQVVNPLSEILHFATGPLPLMNLNGNGNIELKVSGNQNNPHAWGNINFYNTNASLKNIIGIELKNADGCIDFNDQEVEFKLNKGHIDNNPVTLLGTCNLLGKLDVNFAVKDFSIEKGLFSIKNSPELSEIKKILPPIDKISGKTNLSLNFTGNVPDINKIELNKNLFVKGNIKLNNINAGVQDFILSNIYGDLAIDGLNSTINATSKINSSVITFSGKNLGNKIDFKVHSSNLNLKDLLANSAFKGLADDNHISFNGSYNGNSNNIEFDKLILDAQVIKPSTNAPVVLNTGNINIKNGICNIKNISGNITENPFKMNANIKNLGTKFQNINANINLKDANLSTINVIREFYLIPKETKEMLRQFDFKTGKTDIDLKVINNRPFSDIELNDVTISYIPLNMPFKIINGQINLKNDKVLLNKINTLADDMPIFINGEIGNLYQKMHHDIYINSVPKQTFIDKYINKRMLYPLKIRGDIIYSANIKGNLDLYNISANAKIGERSNIYYLGATLGDNENPTIIDFNGDIEKNNTIKIHNFEYNKSVLSQNNKSTIINFVKLKGDIKNLNTEPFFNNLTVKTENPTDARIFNVIFKKPNIKQGLFTSDLKINGKLSDLKIIGDFNIFDINAPLMQTVIKEVALKFTPSTIKINSKGEVLSNEITLNAEAENCLKIPFKIHNGNIHFNKLDVNATIADLNKLEINKPKLENEKQDIDLTTLIIERLNLTANDVLIKGIAAKNLKTLISLSDKMKLTLNDYNVDLANGHINGDFSYNLLSNRVDLLLNAENINANELAIMLFDLPNQMYGNLTGTVNLTCNGTNDKTCLETLNGNGVFNVANGRMPKLGSLEYLLKAGNLIKGGITGLSINSLIDLITPLKTGEFSDIHGSINIAKGIADDIQIATEGKDLNLYIKGNCNLATANAQMYVFGLLSKNIKTPLGAVGNMSLNTLFNLIPGIDLEAQSPFIKDINKIPGIELSQKAYRKFMAEIRGDINGDSYVKSFKWIN